MNAPQDRPQAPQSPVPAGDALGPPDTHTGACGPSGGALERAAAVIAREAWIRLFHGTGATNHPLSAGRCRAVAAELAAAGLLCTPAERALIDAALAEREVYQVRYRRAAEIDAWHAAVDTMHAAADRVLADREARS